MLENGNRAAEQACVIEATVKPFRNFRASQSRNRLNLCRLETPCDDFSSSKVVEGSVGCVVRNDALG